MPDQTDINLEGPDEDDAEAMYDPNEIEVSRGREQGLGFGARDLQRQRDISVGGDATAGGAIERFEEEDRLAAQAIPGDADADVDIDSDGPDAFPQASP